MDVSRRFFIAGATSFGAFGGSRFLFADPSAIPTSVPRLTFGVVSDIHIVKVGAGENPAAWDNNLTFRHTLEWFRREGVDAVMVVGDMADHGMVEELEAVAQAWYSVFPGDRTPDGRPVEKLFAIGNHDYHGFLYGGHAERLYPDGNERMKHILRANIAGHWKRIFNEDYSRFYRKTVKGYTFLGAHWDDGKGPETKYGGSTFGVELGEFLKKDGDKLDPKLPFFYFQHPHPKDTCYGSWAWGHDGGLTTKVLSPYANAIAFSGHSHYSLTDERSVWQDGFTSVGTSSLRYTGMPYNARQPLGYENTTTEPPGGQKEAAEMNALKVMSGYSSGDCRQGMLWRVYDDCIVVQRREFLNDVFVGPDWVLPLTTAESKPFAFAKRAKKTVAPEFPKGAKITLKKIKAKTRKTEGHPSVEKEAYQLTFPAALAAKGARPHEYEITAIGKDGESKAFYVVAEGFNHALSHRRATANSSCTVTVDRLPPETVKFEVRPLDSFWKKGAPLTVSA